MPVIVKPDAVNVITLMHGSHRPTRDIFRQAGHNQYAEVTRIAINKQEIGFIYRDGNMVLQYNLKINTGIEPDIYVPGEDEYMDCGWRRERYCELVFDHIEDEVVMGRENAQDLLLVILQELRILFPFSRFSHDHQYLVLG